MSHPRYLNLSVVPTGWPSTDAGTEGGPRPVQFWILVLAQDVCRPIVPASSSNFWSLVGHSLGSLVNSTQSMSQQNRAGARTQPWRTPKVLRRGHDMSKKWWNSGCFQGFPKGFPIYRVKCCLDVDVSNVERSFKLAVQFKQKSKGEHCIHC